MNINRESHIGPDYSTYDRKGHVSHESDADPGTKRLAAERSASVTPHPDKVEVTRKEPAKQVQELEKIKEILQDKSLPDLHLQKESTHSDRYSKSMLENHVRLLKRKGEKCPYVGPHEECLRPDLRCGDRAQYSERESRAQHARLHRCFYSPFFTGDTIMLVERDTLLSGYIVDTLKLFLSFSSDKIVVLRSAEEAVDTLTHLKLQNRMLGLILINVSTVGKGLVDLLDEIFERNLSAEIVLTGEGVKQDLAIHSELVTHNLEPGLPFISAYIQSPVHSTKLIETISELKFGKYNMQSE